MPRLDYWGNPSHEYISRSEMTLTVLGYAKSQSLYNTFTSEEIDAIRDEALTIDRIRYAPELAAIDRGLLKSAKEGNPAACKLAYQKFEGWVFLESIFTSTTGESEPFGH